MPPEIVIKHPGRASDPIERKVERDPERIKQFFSEL